MTEHVGFIGLGSMGLGMSTNLVKAGFPVHGYDVDAAKCAAFSAHGGVASASPVEAARNANLLFVCVFSAKEAEPLLAAGSGVLAALRPGATVIMHTTMAPEPSRAIAETVLAQGYEYLEAPITGGKAGADAGALTAIVSGSDTAVQTTKPAFDAMCNIVYHVGKEPGAAATVKMINQLLVGIHVSATAEALALAVKAGADPNMTFDVISNGRGNSTAFSARGPLILAGEMELSRTVEIFLKDLGIVLEAGRDLDMPLPLSASAYQLFLGASAISPMSADEPSVVKLYELLNGINIADAAAAAKQAAQN